MAAKLFYLPFPVAFSSNGLPEAGARLFFYETGTVTPQTVFADAGLTVALQNPVVANGAGRLPTVYVDDTKTYRLVITDRQGVTLDDIDPYIPGTAVSALPGATGPAGAPGAPGANAGTIGANAFSRASLKGLSAELQQLPAMLVEPRREGVFVWDETVSTALHQADTAEGIYVAPNPAAVGAWVRRFSGPIDIRWFGGNPNHVAGTPGTDNTPALVAACLMAWRLGGREVHIPAGFWRFASQPVFTRLTRIVGDGWSFNPGAVAGQLFTPPFNLTGTVLVFDANVAGPIFYAQTDNTDVEAVLASYAALLASSPEYKYPNAAGSCVKDLFLWGGWGTNRNAHGLERRTIVDWENVRIENFAGDGFRTIASADVGPEPYGNASGATTFKCVARANMGHGFCTRGRDSNVIGYVGCDSANNGGCGFFDSSLLGNSYSPFNHAATNNRSHPMWSPSWDATHRAALVAEVPELSDAYVGCIVTTSAVAAHRIDGFYTESGGGTKAHIASPAIVIGGNLSSVNLQNFTSTSTMTMLGSQELRNIQEIYPNTNFPFFVKLGASSASILEVQKASGTAIIRANSVTGAFSNLQLFSAGTITDGLDLLAGGAAAYYSCGQHVFRNAAQTTTFGTFSSTGLNLGGVNLEYRINGVKVVGARDTGWTAATGTGSKGAFAATAAGTAGATYDQTFTQATRDRIAALEARVVALDAMLRTHGLIGS